MNENEKNLEWRKKYGANVPEDLIKHMEEMKIDWDERKKIIESTVFISKDGRVDDSIGASGRILMKKICYLKCQK